MPTRNVVVRAFLDTDAEPVAALIRDTLLTSNAADYPLAELELLADWYAAAPLVGRMGMAHRYVAAVDGELVGTGARRDATIEGFFVSPDWQGHGVGALLLAELEASARHDGYDHLDLDSSVTAVGFYLRHGFEQLGAPIDLGEGLVVPMRKDL